MTTSSTCQLCQAGAYSTVSGALDSSACTSCSTGNYASAAGSQTCAQCKVCAASIATISNPCSAGSKADTVTCACNDGFYGSGVSCSPCPTYTYSMKNNSASLLGCICMKGFTCSYTKRIYVTVHLSNMTLAYFLSNYKNTFIAGLASAANVTQDKVTIISSSSTGRRDLKHGLIKFEVSGAEQLSTPTIKGFHGVIEWSHAHSLHVSPHREPHSPMLLRQN